MPKISLCVICGNEEFYITRFLGSFKDAFDELCIVRAVGNQPHDKTLSIAKEWCAKNGKEYRLGEYFNQGWKSLNPDLAINDDEPATWPHVDSFAAARNHAWDIATGDWQIWADCDDLLVDGCAAKIREHAAHAERDMYFFKYSIASQNSSNFRERLFRRGISRWTGPVHETCQLQMGSFPGRTFHAFHDDEVVYSHEPDVTTKQPNRRNLRIVTHYMRHLNSYAYEMHRESFYQYAHSKKPEDRENAIKWAEVAHHADTHGELRAQILINLSALYEDEDIDHSLELGWQAARVIPMRRESWGRLAELYLKAKMPVKAAEAASLMEVMPKPDPSGFPRTERYYGWEGLLLRTRTIRAIGKEDAARKVEDRVFQANGARFSLLHATRGRPEQAIATRAFFFMGAINSLGIEHIFAIDEDDAESLEKLKDYRYVVVKNPNGCVKAWNAAAADSTGAVLVQLSDDWVPCLNWDELFWLALQEAAQAKKVEGKNEFVTPEGHRPFMGEKVPLREVPLVLAVSDGNRTDDLLCMAILTRARYEQQGKEMFSPEYFGVFSDNELTVRAYADGVIVKAKHIQMRHRHPIFEGKKWEEMDSTYQRQNATERYREGLEIFNRRNPNHKINTGVP